MASDILLDTGKRDWVGSKTQITWRTTAVGAQISLGATIDGSD